VKRTALQRRLTDLAVRYDLPDSAITRFERLLEALAAEPDPHTTVREPSAAADYHVADSLSGLEAEPIREARSLVDIGAGAGFPGLPLAIALPGMRVDLLESARRKASLIGRLARAAEVENARAMPLRAEEWAAADGRSQYDVVTARAVAPLAVLVEYAAPLLRVGGSLVAWKGARAPDEERAGEAAAALVGLRPVSIIRVMPYKDVRDLNLHLYLKERQTPEGFPRRPGMAAKRPLA
jgi:16S rRNA (guanine527-N7)-methyltransferase